MQIADILEAEMMVPTSLECSVDLIQDDGSTRSESETIPNDISYGQLNQYKTDGVPRVPFNLTSTVRNAKNGATDAAAGDARAVAALRALNGIGPVMARRIVDRVTNEQQITNYLGQIGITKKRIEILNPRYRIVQ
jgi:hypothetical protein